MSHEPKNTFSQRQVESLVSRLRRRQIVGSHETALETVLVLRQLISKAKFTDIEELIALLKEAGHRLVQAQPKEFAVGNSVRTVLHHIREEYANAIQGSKNPSKSIDSIYNFDHSGQPKNRTARTKFDLRETHDVPSLQQDDQISNTDDKVQSIKPVLMEAIQDIIDELETVYDNVSKNARNHIHSDEIVLTMGQSRTVEEFLKSAAHHRKFTVLVAETAPSYGGHKMAQSLSAAGISTFLVPDSSVYAIMSRVNKVIIGAHAIMANGGMFAITGSSLVATAARAHSTPVVVCAGQFKLTPLWNLHLEYGALDFASPSSVLGFGDGNFLDKVDVVNPYHDYVRPELIDVYVTNDGDHPPLSIYRLIKETYDDDDNEL